MREFMDAEGRRWDATVGKESWGTLVILFAPRDGGAPRKLVLEAETSAVAERELERLTDAELRARVAGAQPWI
jgi:hypothetical protein